MFYYQFKIAHLYKMEQPLSFSIKNETFSVHELLDGDLIDFNIQRLLNALKLNDKSFEEYEPCAEDIFIPQDEWLCYASDVLGITFEFVQKRLCYISFSCGLFDFASYMKPTLLS